jgi:hypothetical protein
MSHPVYRHRAWATVRKQVLERDGYRCQISGPRCLTKANEVDHIVPFSQGGSKYDSVNLQAACKPCNLWKVSQDKREAWRRAGVDIVLVVGPPAAGKSTYVKTHMGPNDLVVDFDVIAQQLGSTSTHDHDELTRHAAAAARQAIIRRLQHGEVEGVPRAWLISANARAESFLPHHRVVVIDPGYHEVQARAVSAGRPPRWHALIDRWYLERGTGTPSAGSRAW